MRTLAAAAVAILGLSIAPVVLADAIAPDIAPCATEDSVGCYWDAQRMGNGTGRSFTVDSDGTVHYWDRTNCSIVTAYDASGARVPILSHDC